jgi:hypothetical protein
VTVSNIAPITRISATLLITNVSPFLCCPSSDGPTSMRLEAEVFSAGRPHCEFLGRAHLSFFAPDDGNEPDSASL